MDKQQHKDRVTAIKLARQDLTNDKNVNQKTAIAFLDKVSQDALAEGDQRNTVFSREGIVAAFKTYSVKNADGKSALPNYLGILDTYADLLRKDNTLVAEPSTMHKAIVSYLMNLQDPDPQNPGEKIARFSREDAEDQANKLSEENCMGIPVAQTSP